MKKLFIVVMVAVLSLGVVITEGFATIMNPDATKYANDDGTILWNHADPVFSIEAADLFGSISVSLFGFYFEGFSGDADVVTIFGPEDQTIFPGDVQQAGIDFAGGQVIDLDDGFAVQDTFTDKGLPIGFVLAFINPVDSTLYKLYSEPTLNGGFGDAVSSFPYLSDPHSYLLAFDVAGIPIALELVGPVSSAAVPEPATFLLLTSGLAGLLIYKKWRIK